MCRFPPEGVISGPNVWAAQVDLAAVFATVFGPARSAAGREDTTEMAVISRGPVVGDAEQRSAPRSKRFQGASLA